MIVGTAGHVDHGKTALVRALTGIDTDRLPEEKKRGISIDLGFAYRAAPGGHSIGYVDVPGHERFVHNMLAGAAGIDLVLLVVAADDGPMPQTREHLAIVEMLGVERALVALTKIDMVDAARQEAALAEIRALLAPTRFAGTDILPVSAPRNLGIGALAERLEREAAQKSRRGLAGGFRLAVDRAFMLPGAGLIATGTAIAGQINVGDEVTISPAGQRARVRTIHAQNRPAQAASAGERCALNLAGAKLGLDSVRRGDWLIAPRLNRPTARFDVRWRHLASEKKPLRHWAPVHVHIGAADVTGRLALLRDEPVEPGEEALAQIVLDRPVAALARDRFILRDQSAQRTIGGGVVIDPWPPNRGRRRPERLALLAALDTTDPVDALAGALGVDPGWIGLPEFAAGWNLADEDAKLAAEIASAELLDSTQGQIAVARQRWSDWRQAVLDCVAQHHAAKPDSPGIDPLRLRMALPQRLPAPLFDSALARLRREAAIASDGPWLKLPGHVARLAPAEERIWLGVEPLLSSAGFAPPRVRDIAKALDLPEESVRRVLKRQARWGRVAEIALDHFFTRERIAAMAATAADLEARSGGGVDTASFRDRLGTGRKIAIQVLEYFDRLGLTHRKGDVRSVRKERIAALGLGADSG